MLPVSFMTHSTNIGLLTGLIVLLLISSCRKFEQFPDEPIISYDGFLLENDITTGVTYRGVLILKYQDGNGDIGLASWDTLPPFNYGSKYYYNLVIDYFEMRNGEWENVDLVFENIQDQTYDTLTFSARIPMLIPPNRNQAISGFIQDTLFLYNPLSEKLYDTIKFSAFIIDRALNESNMIETPPIIVKRDTSLLNSAIKSQFPARSTTSIRVR